MRRYAVCILLLFLSGCSESREINAGLELRSRLLQAEKCVFSVCICVDFDEQLYSFGMDCIADAHGNITFTVTEPESISGISGKLSAEGGDIVFDGTALGFAFVTEEGLSPVSAPWILWNSLRSGYIASACCEDGKVRLSVDDSYEDDSLRLDVWLDSENLPQHADILQNGRRVLSLDVKNVDIV